jgi:hypothetical protein
VQFDVLVVAAVEHLVLDGAELPAALKLHVAVYELRAPEGRSAERELTCARRAEHIAPPCVKVCVCWALLSRVHAKVPL